MILNKTPTTSYPLQPRQDDKRLKRPVRFIARRATAHMRVLPDFLLVGGMKCGTSSMFRSLSRHSMIEPPFRKEVHYFSTGWQQGKSHSWYRAHFPRKSSVHDGSITGEACPAYLFHPTAMARCAMVVPDARIIVILRDPVERAISHYFHEVRMGRERLTIDKAMAVEEERMASISPGSECHDRAAAEMYLHASYKAQGIYVDQLERLYASYPASRVLVMKSEEIFVSPQQEVERALAFLGLEHERDPAGFPAANTGTNREPVSNDLIERLRGYFAPHNARLSAMLGSRFTW
ncbi:sulfotransferase domain-containing protein [Croceicoccus sp. F390]|uniref:Sulfotransferase domain-containing protein n=1 Tax=Croceicoccus esteveae TaxID=3075597 RepID=A0ABU2ZH59_9SPHN|nr:sulfotransferase domain-containing protein [Croceicoccus sp. F390]MDT0575930.1 sulfotransferase domain-containing protein [Croceicoccus sp. F390]